MSRWRRFKEFSELIYGAHKLASLSWTFIAFSFAFVWTVHVSYLLHFRIIDSFMSVNTTISFLLKAELLAIVNLFASRKPMFW